MRRRLVLIIYTIILVIQKKIDAIIAEYEKDLDRYNKELEDFYVVEASDMINKQYYISQRNYYSQLVDEYTDYKYEPYFGRTCFSITCDFEENPEDDYAAEEVASLRDRLRFAWDDDEAETEGY